jgi:hypothetical protein
MNAGVGWSLSPNQKARMSSRPIPALATVRISEVRRARTSGRATGEYIKPS